MDELFKKGKNKLPWWIYNITHLELQMSHFQKEFLESVTAKF